MLEPQRPAFDSDAFLASTGHRRKIVKLGERQIFFAQGGPAKSVFHLHSGRARLTVVSKTGKEATITLLAAGDFVGEESLVSPNARRVATATAITDCTAIEIEAEEMIRAIHDEDGLFEIFKQFLLARSMRIQADLVDQLFNSCEKRLACILLLMAEFGESGEPEKLIPAITEETLAEMIGVPRLDVNLFMNRFHEYGLIHYDGRIRVHKSLLDAILNDRLPGDNTSTPETVGFGR
jgi:CRP/FNR family transcriptional regulator, cyclic AMP receptor protein